MTEQTEQTEQAEPETKVEWSGHAVEASLLCPCGAKVGVPIPMTKDGKFQVPDTLLPTADGFLATHAHLGMAG